MKLVVYLKLELSPDVKHLLDVLAGSANIGNFALISPPTMGLFSLKFLNKLAVSTETLFKIN